jgi:hypothetical protein
VDADITCVLAPRIADWRHPYSHLASCASQRFNMTNALSGSNSPHTSDQPSLPSQFATEPKKFSFACNLTRSGGGVVPSVTFEGDAEGPKFLLKWKPYLGHFRSYSLVASCAAEVTIKGGGDGTGGDGSNRENPINRSIPAPTRPTIALNTNAMPRTIPRLSSRLVMRPPPQAGHNFILPAGMAPFIGALATVGVGLAMAGRFVERNPELLVLLAAG